MITYDLKWTRNGLGFVHESREIKKTRAILLLTELLNGYDEVSIHKHISNNKTKTNATIKSSRANL
jgi:hypothetical protein